MTSKTEVAKGVPEVLKIGEKGGMGKSPYQDLPIPDCNGSSDRNQACELDKSYVFVNGTDGLINDATSEKDVSVSPKSKVDAIVEDQGNGELDGPTGDVIKPLNDGSIGNPPVENDGTGEYESSHVGREDGVSAFEKSVEAEVEHNEAGLAIEKVGEQSGITGGLVELVKFEDFQKAETHPSPVENQESGVGAFEFSTESAANEELINMTALVNSSGNAASGSEDQIASDEYEHQNDESSVEKSRMGQVSQVGVVDVVECKLQDVSLVPGDGVKLSVELVAATEQEVFPSTSSELDMELHTINNEEERLNDDVKTTSQLDMHENQHLDTSHDGSSQVVSEHGDQLINVVSSVDCHVESVNDLASEDKNEESFASHVGSGIQYPEELVKHHDASGIPSENIQAETNTSVSVSAETFPAPHSENPGAEATWTVSALPVDGTTIQVMENGLPIQDQIINCTSEVESSRSGRIADGVVTQEDADAVVLTEKVPTLQGDEGPAETEVLSGLAESSDSQPAMIDVTLEPEVHVQTFSPVSNGEKADTLSGTCRAEVIDSFNTENGSAVNAVEIEDVQKVQNMGDKLGGAAGDSQENVFLPEHEATGESETVDENSEPEVHVHDFSATSTGDKIDAVVSGSCRTVVLDGFNVINEGVTDSGLEIENVQNMEDQLEGVAGVSHDNVLQEKEAIGKSESFDVKLEPGVHTRDFSAINSGEKNDMVSGAHGAEVLDSSNSVNEGMGNTVEEIEDTENLSDEKFSGPAGVILENECLQENGAIGKSDCNNILGAESEGSMPNMSFKEEASVKAKTKPFNFLVRVPRFDDDNLREQIRLAKLNVDEKTKLRDAIQVQIQEKRASNQIHGVDYEFAKEEGRSARKLVRSKRMEIDSLQSMINKAKNALSIEDIDSQIHNMEHMIQHETLPLKEEKQFIREIKQLKQLREQLSSNLGSQDEIKHALEQRKEVEERLKILRKELDVLKDKVLKAEGTAVEAEKRYDDENRKVKELQSQFRAADDVRQSAYAQLQSLRKELSKKNKHFFKYKDAAAVANNYAFSGNSEALYCLCTDNVGIFMELWNTDDEFRKEYVSSNARSTIRRLGTLDGRSLGPNEQPTVLPRYTDERNGSMVAAPMKVDATPHTPVREVKQRKTVENVASNGLPMLKVTEHKKQKEANKEPAVALLENGCDHASGGDAIDQVQEEPKKSSEEMKLIRKAEEMRREEDEAKLKEQRRLEALGKADEARERKKRRAEKLQVRAELKIQKEAEEREKEREKRLRKKERKKAASTDVNDTNHNSETALSCESAPEINKDTEVKDIHSVSPNKPWMSTKQKKSKSVPPPLRNRNKKKLQQWMWVVISSLIIIFLFWLGNIGVFSSKNLKQRSPFY